MGFKLFAAGITNPHLTNQACAFRDEPSADNWIKLQRAMKAHQAAVLYPEGVIRHAIENIDRQLVIPELVKLHDEVQKHTEKAIEAEHVILVKDEPELLEQ